MPTRLVVSLIASLVSVPALGQEPIPQSFLEQLARDLAAVQQPEEPPSAPSVQVVTDDATVYAGAGTDTPEIATLENGAQAQVISTAGEWYGVVLPDDRVGWVEIRNVSPAAETLWYSSEDLEKVLSVAGPGAEIGWFERKVLEQLERAAAFRNTYRDNPYVIVRGLS